MIQEIMTAVVPLTKDQDGVLRVHGTRVPLDTVIAVFKKGATAEEIVQRYPTLHLADVYAVIAYYLQNQAEVEEYLQKRQQFAAAVREQNEAQFDPDGIRSRLLARLHATESQ